MISRLKCFFGKHDYEPRLVRVLYRIMWPTEYNPPKDFERDEWWGFCKVCNYERKV
jgi:hypothetical protein